jgi:hypothetical protein
VNDIDVVGNWPGVHRLEQRKRRMRIEDLGLAGVFQCEPDLQAVRGRRDIRAERTRLRDLADGGVIGDGDDVNLRIERRADIAVFAVRRENLHSRPVRRDYPGFFLEGRAVEHQDIIFTADGDPDFLAIGREKSLVRRAADISDVLHRICRRVDETDGIRSDRDNGERVTVGREAHAVHQDLSLV